MIQQPHGAVPADVLGGRGMELGMPHGDINDPVPGAVPARSGNVELLEVEMAFQ